MLSYMFRRLLSVVPSMFLLSLMVFILIQLPPGDFVDTYAAALAASGKMVDAASMADLRHQYGLDQNLFVQYFHWIAGVLQGDLGYSLVERAPVASLLGKYLGPTLVMSLVSLALAWLLAWPVGIYAAAKQNSLGGRLLGGAGLIGLALPQFLLALLVSFIGLKYCGSNPGSLFSPGVRHVAGSWFWWQDLFRHLWPPVLLVSVAVLASLIRVMLVNLRDQLRMPYVMAARARGLSETRVLLGYPARVALNPFVSALGWLLPNLISGVLVVSIVLNLQTLGPLLYRSLLSHDAYLSGAILLSISLLTAIGMLISDLFLAFLDPRIRFEQ